MRHWIFFFTFLLFSIFAFGQKNLSVSLNIENQSIQSKDLKFANDSQLSFVGIAKAPTLLTLNSDIVLTRTDKRFNIKKAILLGDTSYELGRSHTIDKQGNTLIVGTSSPYEFTVTPSGFVLKLDPQWNVVWAKKVFVNSYSSEVRFCKQVKDGNYLIGGKVNSNWEDARGFLCKLDSAGNPLWCKSYKREFASFNSLDEDSLGQLFVTGYSSMGMNSSFAMKLNDTGAVIWDGFILGWSHMNGKFGPDGHVYVVGEAPANSRRGFLIHKYNGLTGQRMWTRKYNTYLTAYIAFDLCFDGSGHLYVLGSGSSSNSGTHILKMNYSGDLVKHVSLKNSYVMANYDDNQAMLYDPNSKQIWVSACDPNSSSSRYLFYIDTALAVKSCLQTQNFPVDTVSSTGIISPIKVTTVSNLDADLQSFTILKREISFVPMQNCFDCESMNPNFSFSKITNSSFSFTITSDSGSEYSYSWFFGDGNSSQLKNPVHNFLSEGKYSVKLLVIGPDGLCKDSISKEIVVEKEPVGTEEIFKTQGISVFPNPSNDFFSIRFQNLPLEKQLRLLDLSGKEIANFKVDESSDFMISGKHLLPGLYWIEVKSEGRTYRMKVLK